MYSEFANGRILGFLSQESGSDARVNSGMWIYTAGGAFV